MLEAGIKGTGSVEVVRENTAAAVGSGMLGSTLLPMMIALMEKTACESVAPYLEKGSGTIGTELNVNMCCYPDRYAGYL